MASITTILDSDQVSASRAIINTNFSNLNAAIATVPLTLTANADGFSIAGGTVSRNLTLIGADVTLTGSGTAVLTFPTTTDTIVGRATTDTLTNKTLTSPVLTTPTLGVATATSINGNTFTTGTYTLTGTAAKKIGRAHV